MKKTIFKVAIVAVFALIAGYNVYTSQRSVDLSAFALDNIEALAYGGEQISDCAGCNSPWDGICKVRSWGGCLGYRYL